MPAPTVTLVWGPGGVEAAPPDDKDLADEAGPTWLAQWTECTQPPATESTTATAR